MNHAVYPIVGHYRPKDNTSTTKVLAKYKTGIVQLALFYSVFHSRIGYHPIAVSPYDTTIQQVAKPADS